ncbi:hypothetical protein A0Y87_04945 [Campylobacter lari]|nr:hypothetical protein [Campylobacter lari]
MFKSYKKFVIYSLLIPLPFILFLVVLLYVYDPLQLYHEPWFRKKTYHDDMRIQAKGIIDHNDFDSVIFGTSMLQNTSSSEASAKLGGQFANLSISGGTFQERAVILKYILKHKQIKNVIYSLDSFTLVNGDNDKTNLKQFDFLYNKNIYDDFKIYLNRKFIKCSLTFSNKKKCVGNDDKLETLTYWINHKNNKKLFGGFENWLDSSRLKREVINNINFKVEKKHFDLNFKINNLDYINKNLISIVESNSHTSFHFIIPTYSRLFYKMNKYDNYFQSDSMEHFFKYKFYLTYLVCSFSKYPNIKIYGFDNLDYADNLSNYKDPVHYNIDMNSMQLDAIRNQTNILTPENMDEYFKIMEEKIKNYDLNPLIEQIKASGILDK